MPPWSKAAGGGPGIPAQPIQEPRPACTIGASALTRPPGLTSQEPPAARTTGSRFATMTISSDGDGLELTGPTVAPTPPRGARVGCLCVTRCGSVCAMNAQRILGSGVAALVVLIVLAIVFHDDGKGTPPAGSTPPPTAAGVLRAHVAQGNLTLDGPVKDAGEKKDIEKAAG